MGSGDLYDDESQRIDKRRMSAILNGPQMRSMRLIGNTNPRYRWDRYWKTEDQLARLKKPLRQYYERTNYLIQQYLYIDKLLDSSLPHDLLNEYNNVPALAPRGVQILDTMTEEPSPLPPSDGEASPTHSSHLVPHSTNATKKVNRTPRNIYHPNELTPLFSGTDGDNDDDDDEDGLDPKPDIPWLEDDDVDSGDRIVALAIYINFAANAVLLAGKIAVVFSVPSVSVMASLVDAALDFLSTGIVWVTTWLISHHDQYRYPTGRRR